jgi:hypothetical protein
MQNGNVSEHVAREEVQAWLEARKTKEAKKEELEANIEILVAAVAAGELTRNAETNELTLHLGDDPIEKKDGGKIEKLVFKPRLRVADLNIKLKKYGPQDVDNRLLAYASASTGVSEGFLGRMYSDQFEVCKVIALFFA